MSNNYYAVVRSTDNHLEHYGIPGMKWGVRKAIKRVTDSVASIGRKGAKVSNEVLFVSGSSKTQDKASPYYQRKLPKPVRKNLKASIRAKDTIIVGDAPGIDRQTQNYLKKKRYMNVEVYGPGTKVRYSANSKWKTHPINDTHHEVGSKEWLAKKDIAMTNRATKGLAVILDEGATATRNNIKRLSSQKKASSVYTLYPRKKKR